MWSNFRMRFVITSFWVLMKSFQRSPEMPVITCILLSPPWTDGKVWRNWLRVVFTDQDVGCNDLWNTCTGFGYSILQTGISLSLGSLSKYRVFTFTIQMTLSSNLYIFQLRLRKWFAVVKGMSMWHVYLFRNTIWIPVNKVFKHRCVWLFSNEPCSQALQG